LHFMDALSAELNALRMNESDNVAIALVPLRAGTLARLCECAVPCLDDIPTGHKVALQSVAEGGAVIKYGSPIGIALQPIAPGEHVHIHNVASRRMGGVP